MSGAARSSNGQARILVEILFLAACYFVAGKLGLAFASLNPSASAIWAPTGIAIGALLTRGLRVWPGIFLGAFLVNVTTAGTTLTSALIALGNTLEGVAGAYLVARFANGAEVFERAQDVFKFVGLTSIAASVSATVGVTSLLLSGFASARDYAAIWQTWWLGDTAGALVVTPLILLWSKYRTFTVDRRGIFERVALLLYLFLVSQIVFGPSAGTHAYPLEFLCIPFLIWAAVRFGPQEAAAAVLVLSAVATWGTLGRYGPFVHGSQDESLVLLQAFNGVMSVMTLTLAAVVAERRRAEEKIELLATTDALTGLANYRKLVEVTEVEMKRAERTGRALALLLFDLDGLKQINDSLGHLAGSRALCRVANVLRMHSRSVDTAARYGGDEFALILPESGAEIALAVADRIRAQFAKDSEKPTLSVSVGVSEFRGGGQTFQDLFHAADGELYQMKHRTLRQRHYESV